MAQFFLRTKFNQDKSYIQTVLEKYKNKWDSAKLAKFCLALPLTYEVIELIRKLPPEAEKFTGKMYNTFIYSKVRKSWLSGS